MLLFFNHRWIRRAVKGAIPLGGSGGMLPQKILKSWSLWNAISSVLRGQILSKMFSKSIVLSFENFRTTVEIWNFPIPNAYWSGFGIFEQNRKDPDEIRMIKESSQTHFLWPHLCLTRLNEFRFFLTYFLRTSFKFSSMQSVECALKTR